jgi:hypothetical protein
MSSGVNKGWKAQMKACMGECGMVGRVNITVKAICGNFCHKNVNTTILTCDMVNF